MFFWPWKRPVGVAKGKLRSTGSGRLQPTWRQEVAHPQWPIASLVRVEETTVLVVDVHQTRDLSPLLVELHAQGSNLLAKGDILLLKVDQNFFLARDIILGSSRKTGSHLSELWWIEEGFPGSWLPQQTACNSVNSWLILFPVAPIVYKCSLCEDF